MGKFGYLCLNILVYVGVESSDVDDDLPHVNLVVILFVNVLEQVLSKEITLRKYLALKLFQEVFLLLKPWKDSLGRRFYKRCSQCDLINMRLMIKTSSKNVGNKK